MVDTEQSVIISFVFPHEEPKRDIFCLLYAGGVKDENYKKSHVLREDAYTRSNALSKSKPSMPQGTYAQMPIPKITC